MQFFERVSPRGRRVVEPDRFARGRQRAVRERKPPSRFAHHLRRGGRAEKLAAAAPGEPHARQPRSAASSSVINHVRESRAQRLHRLPRPRHPKRAG